MILPTLVSARRRRCALAAIAVCLGSSITVVGPAQAAPAPDAQPPIAAQAAAANPAGGAHRGDGSAQAHRDGGQCAAASSRRHEGRGDHESSL